MADLFCLVSDCKKTFPNSTVLTAHLLINHCSSKQGTFNCPLCHHVVGTDHDILAYHIRSYHTGDKPYHCPDCTCSFSLEANLNTHCRVRHQVQVTSGHPFLRSNSKDYHVHHQVKKSSVSPVSDQIHQPVPVALSKFKNKHRNTCIDTNKTYVYEDSKKTLPHHCHNNDNKQKPYVCSYKDCGESFSRLSCLTTHTRTHNGKKSYVCKDCGKKFAISKKLTLHYHTHTGQKMFVCGHKDCGKGFAKSYLLIKHKRTHNINKTFVCKSCGKSFTSSQNLAKHYCIHTKDKPHICKDCGKCFARSSALTAHVGIHTWKKPYICKE